MIQSNMTPEAIVEIWRITAEVFKKYKVPLKRQSLEILVEDEILPLLLQELNSAIGSSPKTCIEGG
ncbi:hypothetical protein [Pseudoneobacillus sp. C159]